MIANQDNDPKRTLATPADIQRVDMTCPFYLQINSLVRATTLPAIIDSLKSTGRYYALSWTPETAPRQAHCFWDSDCYKVMEACCYFLMKHDDSGLREDVETYIGFVKNAQWDDGYINSYYTLAQPHNRLTNLRDMHELYCLGHLMEFAVAYHGLTGSWDLIDVCRKFVALLHTTVIPKGGYPGHEELELALVRASEVTQDPLFLDTAGYFVRERGKQDSGGQTYYDRETIARGLKPSSDLGRGNFCGPRDYAYMQAHLPLAEQTEITGHCVRAMYYLTGALHYALLTPNESQDILTAVSNLFDDVSRKKMYLTGGLGSVARNEGFGPRYFLPDLQEGGGCYSETCASFGLIMLCERFLRGDLVGKYGDIMERALMNCVIGALGMDGASFYYQNPLATVPDKPWRRSKWFDVACCPPNIVKLVGLLPSLVFSTRDSTSTVAVHLYFGATFTTKVKGSDVSVAMESGMPWEGTVKISTRSDAPFELALRIPAWTEGDYTSSLSGTERDGYLYVQIATDTEIDLKFSTTPRFVYAHPRTRKEEVAVIRGPLVYCAEGVDNGFELETTFVSTASPVKEVSYIDIGTIKAVPVLEVEGRVRKGFDDEEADLYTTSPVAWEQQVKKVKLIPFFLRENRGGNGAMRVWWKRGQS